jgi:hypothetical protein
VTIVQWNVVDKSTLMMGVRPSSGTFFPPITIHSVKAQKVKVYIYLTENNGSYEVNTL